MNRHGWSLAVAACLAVAALASVATMRAGDIAAKFDGGGDGKAATTSPSVRPLAPDDHFLGNPNAAVTFVVYNDFECPYCKLFHPTAVSLVEALGQGGQVAVAYRHFPNERSHPRAKDAAVAAECVAELGGSDKFFSYADILFAGAPDSLTDEALQAAAAGLGIDAEAFAACRTGLDARARVERDYQDGLALARNDPAFGTPYTVAVARSGAQVTISGNATRAELIQVAQTLIAAEPQTATTSAAAAAPAN